jgi:large subunit ribosomal protein L3
LRLEEKIERRQRSRVFFQLSLLAFCIKKATKRMKFLLGKKLGMSQQFREDGTVIPVTLIAATPNTVTAIRDEAKDGYTAVQVGMGVSKRLTKPQTGHLKGLPSVAVTREFRDVSGLERGAELTVSQFVPGEKVNVTGVSKGKGFQGVVKRHHFGGGPRTHGHKDNLRMPGSIGAGGNQHVLKGTRMGGHMGDENVTIQNLEVISIDVERHQIAVKGAVPGARGTLLAIREAGRDTWTAPTK